LDPRQLDQAQLDAATQIFEEMKSQKMLPFHEADQDPVRQELDRRLLIEVLGFGPNVLAAIDLLRSKLCAEPSVHGGKRPASVPVK